MDATHEIFQSPFAVDLQYEEMPTRPNYPKYPGGEGLPAKMQIWRVAKDTPNGPWGLVASGCRFTDSPDCEFIAGGLNSKEVDSVAIGRQGNWFLWGFVASPSQMQAEARKAFLNSVVYIRKYDGQQALVESVATPRDWALFYAPERFYTGKKIREKIQQRMSAQFLAVHDNDPDSFEQYLKSNLGYIYIPGVNKQDKNSVGGRRPKQILTLDEDAQALGIANDDIRLLQHCVAALRDRQNKDRALRILVRYTDTGLGDDAKAWSQWLAASRDRLFFSDAGGYKWFVKPKDYGVKPAKLKPEAVEADAQRSEQ